MTPKSELRSTQSTWLPIDSRLPDEHLANAIKHLDTRVFITPWLVRIQRLINKHNR